MIHLILKDFFFCAKNCKVHLLSETRWFCLLEEEKTSFVQLTDRQAQSRARQTADR